LPRAVLFLQPDFDSVGSTGPTMDSPPAPADPRSGSILRAILIGGIACGVCDYLFAFFYYKKATWFGIARSVARGLLSRETVTGGSGWVVVLGIGLHFLISLGAAAVFVLVSRRLAVLVRFSVPAGLAYGAAIYLVMRWVVVPLSAIGGFPSTVDWGALAGHLVFVGLPIALAARWFGPPPART
jgi:hypothetical protein